MKPEEIRSSVQSAKRSLRQRLVDFLVQAKALALYPAALLFLPYFRIEDTKGLISVAIAKLK